MGSVSGDVNTLSMYCVDAADLESRPIASLQNGDLAFVNTKKGTVEGPMFFLDKESVLPVDGVGVLSTLANTGRWLSLALYNGAGGGGGGTPLSIQGFNPVGAGPIWTFVLPPLAPASKVQLFINGVFYEQGVDFTVLGSTVTWNTGAGSPFPLVNTDRVVCVYQTP